MSLFNTINRTILALCSTNNWEELSRCSAMLKGYELRQSQKIRLQISRARYQLRRSKDPDYSRKLQSFISNKTTEAALSEQHTLCYYRLEDGAALAALMDLGHEKQSSKDLERAYRLGCFVFNVSNRLDNYCRIVAPYQPDRITASPGQPVLLSEDFLIWHDDIASFLKQQKYENFPHGLPAANHMMTVIKANTTPPGGWPANIDKIMDNLIYIADYPDISLRQMRIISGIPRPPRHALG